MFCRKKKSVPGKLDRASFWMSQVRTEIILTTWDKFQLEMAEKLLSQDDFFEWLLRMALRYLITQYQAWSLSE